MLQNIGLNKISYNNNIKFKGEKANMPVTPAINTPEQPLKNIQAQNVINNINTALTQSDTEKYVFLTNLLKDMPISENAEGLTPNKQLDYLLKSGKLLQKTVSMT